MTTKRVVMKGVLSGLTNMVFLVLYLSCSGTGNKSNSRIIFGEKPDNIKRKPPSSYSDTITIDFPSAVFYNSDSIQLVKIRAITDSGIFESLMHECFYQMSYSRMALKKNWPKIKIIEIKNARFLMFKSVDGGKEYLDLDTKNDPCGILLFDGRKKARLVDMTNIDSELGFYFEKF